MISEIKQTKKKMLILLMITEMEFKSKTRRFKDDAKKGIREWTTTLEQSFRVETK